MKASFFFAVDLANCESLGCGDESFVPPVSAETITIEGFLDDFAWRNEKMPERPFCWVLGSGASVQSGIPTGGKLAEQWLKEIHVREDRAKRPLEEWATKKNLGIPGFDYANLANFYPWIYQRRYRDFKAQGYAFLEDAMDRAEPSFGYSVLAQIMAGPLHRVAVTTNFDNLIADALAIYTHTFPLVCGHESLTGYISAKLRRPLIAKVHRDLLLNPKGTPEEIGRLPSEWKNALKIIFNNFTPIVIGYGGNDGSLMGFLKELDPIQGGLFWCYRGADEPEQKVRELVEHHHGYLVPIAGFDEVMLQIWQKLTLPTPIPTLQKTHDERVAAYNKQAKQLNAALKQKAKTKTAEAARKPARAAAADAVERLTKEKNWWAWQLKADAEHDPAKREAIYREGLQDLPKSPQLIGYFALFLEEVRKNYKEAERLYRKALQLAPNDADNTANFAVFMESRKKHDEAERLYRKALDLAPNDADNTGNFALFMQKVRKNFDEAELLFRKAVELDPKDAGAIGNLAAFLEDVRQKYDEAGRLYRKALQLDPTNKWVKTRYAQFRKEHRS